MKSRARSPSSARTKSTRPRASAAWARTWIHERSRARSVDAHAHRDRDHDGIPDSLHAHGPRDILRLHRLLRPDAVLGEQPRLRFDGPAHLRRHDQRRADLHSAIRAHGLRDGARRARRQDVLLDPARVPPRAGVARGRDADRVYVLGIASGLVGAVVVLMGVIAFNPMLRAGYDVKLASGVITAGGTLGILIPPSVMIIVYAAVAGQSVVKLYAAAMFPGFFLAFLYLVYIVGWAMINPKIAPPLSEELTRVPVPAWMRKFQSAYSNNMLVGLISALFSPSRAMAIEADKERISYWTLCKDFCAALVPFVLVVGTLWLTWWYVVIHQQAAAEAAVSGVQQLGSPGLSGPAATPAEHGPPEGFYFWFGLCVVAGVLMLVRYYWRMDADRLVVLKLLTSSVMPLGILTVVVLAVILFGITTATESAGVGAAGAFLLAFQARTLDWKRTKEAVFLTAKTTAMVCWLFVGSALFSGVFAILGGQALLEKWVLSLNMSPVQFMILSQAIIFVLGWPLEWTEIIVIFVPIFLPLLKHFNIDPVLWGTLVFVNLQAAFLSPPVAMSAFYLKGVSPPHVTLNQIFSGMMP